MMDYAVVGLLFAICWAAAVCAWTLIDCESVLREAVRLLREIRDEERKPR